MPLEIDDINIGGFLSANTVSATTIVYGGQPIQNVFIQNVSGGYLPISGGTVTGRTIFNFGLSASTLSATTYYGDGSNLTGIGSGSSTYVQPGSNIITGGTINSPIISVVNSPSFNNLSLSGQLTSIDGILGNTFSANSINLREIEIPNNPISAATIFVRNKAGRRMTGQVGPSGIDYTFQPSVYGNKIALWNPPGNSTTVPGVLGMAALTATGTVTLRNVATTNMFTRTKRLSVVSNSAAGSLCGYRLAVAQYTVGNGSGLGGFMYVIRFGVSDSNTATRMFVGLRNTTAAPANVEPSTLTNCIGVGNGAANTNLFIYYGGSAAQTPIDLGANFPCNTNSVDLYELTLFAPPNSNNTVGYRIERLNTGDVASGTLTGVAGTALPASTTLLTLNDFRTNNVNGGSVSIDYVSIYVETDY